MFLSTGRSCWKLVAAAMLLVAGLRRRFDLRSPGCGSSSSFFFVQLTDPQLGMLTYASNDVAVALDWSIERQMLEMAITEVNRLSPAFVFAGGDFQNWWPQPTGRNGVLEGRGEVGEAQVADVQRAFSRLNPGIELYPTPGNHDIDDTPNNATMRRYATLWGAASAQGFSFEAEGHLFLVLNSMVYFDGSQAGAAASTQSSWLRREIARARSRPELTGGAFVLTHVCPFVSSPDEPAGWANWPLAARHEVLGVTTSGAGDKAVRLWLCGHLHSNTGSTTDVDGTGVEVVVTSAVGSRMQWDGKVTNELAPSEAAAIATQPMSKAFLEHMLLGTDGKVNTSQLATRIRATPDWSGVRVVQVASDGSYRHRWFTLRELAVQKALDDAAMGGARWRCR